MTIPAILRENLRLKVLSLTMAIIFWFFVSYDRDASLSLFAPVELRNLPPWLTVSHASLPGVAVTVTGSRLQLVHLERKGLRVSLDLRGAGEGTTSFPGLEKLIEVPAGVVVTRVSPSNIDVRIGRAAGDRNR